MHSLHTDFRLHYLAFSFLICIIERTYYEYCDRQWSSIECAGCVRLLAMVNELLPTVALRECVLDFGFCWRLVSIYSDILQRFRSVLGYPWVLLDLGYSDSIFGQLRQKFADQVMQRCSEHFSRVLWLGCLNQAV